MRLHRTLNILEDDLGPLLLLGSLHFTVAAAHALFDIGATSLLVTHLGADVLPQVYVGSAVLLIGTGLFVIPIIDRLDRVRLFGLSLIVFASFLAGSHLVGEQVPGIVYRALYMICYLMKSLLFLQFWLIAGDVCDLRQAKRLFPILLGFSLAGGFAASIAASILPRWIATEELLIVAAVLLLLGIVPTTRVSRFYRSRLTVPAVRVKFRLRDTIRRFRNDLSIALGAPLLRNLSLCFLLFALLAQVMDYLMGKAASLHYIAPGGGVDPQALTSFYAALSGGVIGAGALVQFLFANRLISSIGVTRGQLTGPIAFLVGFGSIGAVLMATGSEPSATFFFVVLAGRAIQKVIRISVYRSSTDLIFNPIPSERRGRSKALKETVIEPTGALVGGLFLLASGLFDLKVLLGASFGLAVVFLLLSLQLKTDYLESLVHVLKEKSRFRFAFSSRIAQPIDKGGERPAMVSDLERALDAEEVTVRLLAVEVAAELREPAAAPLLVRRFQQEPDPKVRATMATALGKLLRRTTDSTSALEPALEDEDPRVRANGIEALAQMGIAGSSILLPSFSGAAEPRIRANTAVALSRLDLKAGTEKGREILLHMYSAHEERARLSGLYGLGEIADEKALEYLEIALSDPSASVRRRALMSLAQSGRRQAIDRLIQHLEEGVGGAKHMASRALEACGEAAVDPLILALWSTDADTRRYVIRTLGHIGTPRALQALLHILSLEAEEAYYDLVRLVKIQQLPHTPGTTLLSTTLAERVAQAKRNALQVLRSAYGDRRGMRLILSNLSHPEPYVRSSAIEALEVRTDSSLVSGILPLFEHGNPKVAAEQGGSYFQLPSKEPLEVLFELAGDRSRWLRACALYALGQVGNERAIPLLERKVSDPYELARLNAIEALGELAGSAGLPFLERVSKKCGGRERRYAETASRRIRTRIAKSSD